MSDEVLVVYWSGTGNTKMMAEAVAAGITEAGGQPVLCQPGQVDLERVSQAKALALGCPSMGDEILEEDEMEPFVASLGASQLSGKALALFGSYDWGDGQWMRDWEQRMKAHGASLGNPGLIVHLEPGKAELELCRKLGRDLAGL